MRKQNFALFFGNGLFFPSELVTAARVEMKKALEDAGYGVLMMPESETRLGGVESPEEGRKYAAWLATQKGKYDGVIICLPNFGNENSAILGLRDCGTPILIQAYPDELGKMGVKFRRDAYCGKLSIMDLFYQARLPYTVYKPHTVHPAAPRFREMLDDFAGVCRVVNGMRRFTVGAVGARPTPFKTVRADERTLESLGISTETLDLSDVFGRINAMNADTDRYRERDKALRGYTDWNCIPDASYDRLVKLSLVLDELIEEFRFDCLSLRCWNEFEKYLNICPCVILSYLNDLGIPAACEVDIGNAVSMYALHLASGKSPAILDWNNNYGDDDQKCVLFHCGPVAASLLQGSGKIVDNPLQAVQHGPDHSWGSNTGRIKPGPFTFASARTEKGGLGFYVGEGEFTADPLDPDYFGAAGVARIENLQEILLNAGQTGFIHHVSVAPDRVRSILEEAFEKYLGYEVIRF